ncbi:hypothetical protein GCM10010308_07700 [Streptomyces vinaceusdrappus]|nr:hypothetical protein GCM10010308_07700 [Streptomyces vinaceusdrappus]
MDDPMTLGMPLDPPDPVVHCPVCNRAARERERAKERNDPSAVTDANVVIRSHPHEGKRPAL